MISSKLIEDFKIIEYRSKKSLDNKYDLKKEAYIRDIEKISVNIISIFNNIEENINLEIISKLMENNNFSLYKLIKAYGLLDNGLNNLNDFNIKYKIYLSFLNEYIHDNSENILKIKESREIIQSISKNHSKSLFKKNINPNILSILND